MARNDLGGYMSKILGLDLGTNSIGWAIIDDAAEEIIDSGVRIFQEGVNRSNTGSELSKNADRRNARQIRRQFQRRRMRRQSLAKYLEEIGLYDTNQKNEINKINPYEVRAKSLGKMLEPFELGRALQHINQRRGFKSNRKTGDNEDSKVFTGGNEGVIGINETQKAMQEQNCRTLGEYLFQLDSKTSRRRNRYTHRAMYIHEFNLIWDHQQPFYPEILTDEHKDFIYHKIFDQRKLKSQKHTVGKCSLEPKKHASPKSSPVFQHFRILEQLSRITISTPERDRSMLTTEEWEILKTALFQKKEIKFPTIRKLLGLPSNCRINIEDLGKLEGHKTYYSLKACFGQEMWAKLSDEKKYEIWHTLHFSDSEEWLKRYASDKWGLSTEQTGRILKVQLEQGYARLSHKALSKLIANWKPGLAYDKVVEASGYHFSQNTNAENLKEKLPIPENIRNPIVMKALYEVRQVVNCLIDEFGKPDVVRVELARELKQGKRIRDKQRIENFKRQRKADSVRSFLSTELEFQHPTREDVQRYLLWEECDKICPYTGKSISVNALFGTEFQIEHIIPYSRSLDDSMANKTLCYWEENQEKHNKIPYEAYSGNEKRYAEIIHRVEKKLKHKLHKFLLKTVDDDFVSQQLNDTAYISRATAQYLKEVFPKVQGVKGGTTARLRHFWGLNSILSGSIELKNREDHRHHAVDALVVANTTPSYVHSLSKYHEYDQTPRMERFPDPWKTFRTDSTKSIANILVSHKVRKRVRGKLHEETNYGKINVNGVEHFVVRKPIESLTPKMIGNIVDHAVRDRILSRLKDLQVDTSGKYTIPKETFTKPAYMRGGKVQIKSVRVKIPASNMILLRPDQNLYVEPGSNHHIDIFRNEDGKHKGIVTSLYSEAQSILKGTQSKHNEPIGGSWTLWNSFSINELILLDVDEEQINWKNPPEGYILGGQLFRIQKMDVNSNITLRHHTIASLKNSEGIELGRVNKRGGSLKGTKVTVDPIGKLQRTDE